jgi:hypothetical protein
MANKGSIVILSPNGHMYVELTQRVGYHQSSCQLVEGKGYQALIDNWRLQLLSFQVQGLVWVLLLLV